MKYFILLFTLLFHSLVYSQLNTSNRTVNQKLNFKAGANFDSLTASTLLVLDGSKNLTSSSVTQTNLDFIDNLLGLDTNGDGLMVFNDSTDAFSSVTITGTSDAITVTNGDGIAGAPTIDIADNPILGGTEGVTIPNGTTAQRPVSPSTGELRWNTSETAAEIYDGTDWSAVGGGLGSAQTISIVQADDDSTDFSGNDATFDGAGASINGSITENTTASNFLTGEKKVYFYDASATPQNDYFGWTRNIPQGWRGRTIAYEFTYRTDAVYQNGDIAWQIKDNTNGDLLIINGLPLDQANNANGNGETIRGLVNIPEDAASLDFGFQVTGTTASFDFFVDKISLDIDDFNYKQVNAATDWTNYGGITFSATTTAPTKATSPDTDNITCRRLGDSLDCRVAYRHSSATGAAAGSGAYLIEIPDGLTIDSTKVKFYTGTLSGDWVTDNAVGSGVSFDGGVNEKPMVVSVYDSTHVRMFDTEDDEVIRSGFRPLTIPQVGYVFRFTVPIKGWSATTKHVVVDSGDAESIEIYFDGYAGDGSTNTKIPYFTNGDTASGGEFLTIENSSVNGFSITAKQRIEVNITFMFNSAATTDFAGISLNSTQLTTNIDGITPNDQLATVRYSSTNDFATMTVTKVMEAGDVIRPHTQGQGVVDATEVSFRVVARKATQGEYHLVPVTDQENVFSARIQNNGTCTILEQNVPFIESCNRFLLGQTTLTWKSGFFTETPSCTLGARGIATFTSIPNTTSQNVLTKNSASNPSDNDLDYNITCVFQGSQYKPPKAFIANITPTEFVQTPNSSMPVIYSVKVSDGTATTTISQEYSAWINGVCSNASAGNYVCTLESGVFSASPNCTASATSSYNSAAVVAASASSINIVLRDVSSASNADGDFFLMCHGVQ